MPENPKNGGYLRSFAQQRHIRCLRLSSNHLECCCLPHAGRRTPRIARDGGIRPCPSKARLASGCFADSQLVHQLRQPIAFLPETVIVSQAITTAAMVWSESSWLLEEFQWKLQLMWRAARRLESALHVLAKHIRSGEFPTGWGRNQ